MAGGRRIVWTLEATINLEEILEYVRRDSELAARQLLAETLAAAESLGALSERGRVVPEIAEPAIREIFLRRRRLIYRVSDETVEILSVIHGARDFQRWRSND